MEVRAGSPVRLSSFSPERGQVKVPSLTVSLTEESRSGAVWSFTVDAVLGMPQATVRRLGVVDSIPPTVTGVPSRTVLEASMPGAIDWIVEVHRESGSGIQGNDALETWCDVEIALSPEIGTPGLRAIEPYAELHGERWQYLAAGLIAGVTNVAVVANRRVHLVSAWQVGVGGAVSVAGGAYAPIPPDGSVVFQPLGRIRGPLTVQFAGIPVGGGGYLIETTN